MTAPVRDPQQAVQICGDTYHNARMGRDHTCELPTGHAGAHRCALCGGEWPNRWPASLTPEGRADLRRACVEIRRLVDHEDLAGLWYCASDCLRDLSEYGDQQ